MTIHRINGVDFIDRISKISESYEKIVLTKDFLDDYRSEVRHAVTEIDSSVEEGKIYHAISDSIKESEKTLLIELYTTAEQMMKETKYHLLGFDETETDRMQLFLNYKLDPEKFSPNSKFEQINCFLKRYNSPKLLLKKLDLYDQMINQRHAYAHSGNYRFDIRSVPKIIEILYYLEFEYRSFLSRSSYCELSKILSKIGAFQGNDNRKQLQYDEIKKELRRTIRETINDLQGNSIILNEMYILLRELLVEDEFKIFESKLKCFYNSIQNNYCS